MFDKITRERLGFKILYLNLKSYQREKNVRFFETGKSLEKFTNKYFQ